MEPQRTGQHISKALPGLPVPSGERVHCATGLRPFSGGSEQEYV